MRQSKDENAAAESALSELRKAPQRFLLFLAWAHVAIAAAVALAVGSDPIVFGGLAAILTAAAMAVDKFMSPEIGRSALMVALQGQVALFVAILAGHPWQIDAHMYFFAVLGLGVLLVDVGALIAAAAAVAAHHLALNFLAGTLVYPDGGDLGRTMLHAVVLAIETVGLVFAAFIIKRLLVSTCESQQAAETELANAQLASERARTVELEAEERRREMMGDLESAFREVVDAAVAGDLSKRAPTDFDSDELNRLASAINQLVEQVEESLAAAIDSLSGIAQGDFRTRMDGAFEGRFRDLMNWINATSSNLEELIVEIQGVSSQLESATGEINRTAADMSNRAEEQTSLLSQTSGAMTKMTESTRSNAESAESGRLTANDAAQRAESGGEIVRETVTAMGRIEAEAARIADIISLIDGIAFQTNLLALNAAVEAARAGESGKGFAVVASEVRALAQRSADAAKDIRELIAESSEQVAAGVTLVNRTGEALNEIVEAINQVANNVGEISSATSAQAANIDEANKAVEHIGRMTEQSATMAEANASTAARLAEQGAKLADLLSEFMIGELDAVDEQTAA